MSEPNGQPENTENITLVISPNVDPRIDVPQVAQASVDTGVANTNSDINTVAVEPAQKPIDEIQPTSTQNDQPEGQIIAQPAYQDPNLVNNQSQQASVEIVINPQTESEEKQSWLSGLIDSRNLSMGLTILMVGSVIVIGALTALSMYYRVYLSRHRTPLFNAPNWLRMFFPKPVNYEHEITVLCAKYLDN